MKKIVLTGGGTAGHVTPNIALIPELKNRGAFLIQEMKNKLRAHMDHIRRYGEDLPEVRDWRWPGKPPHS